MSEFRNEPKVITISPKNLAGLIGGAVAIFVLIVGATSATTVVDPGHRGVRVTLGKVSPAFETEGLKFKAPFITEIRQVSIRQQTMDLVTECYSSDLQQVKATMRVLYRIPEAAVVSLYREYQGENYFESLIKPRVIEALKEVASTQSAEMIVQNRESIKQQTLESTRTKIGEVSQGGGPLIIIEDTPLSDLALSPELNTAIEQKMTQKEEAERARFVQQQTEIEAETAIIRAKGEAESIEIRGKELRENPAFLKLQIVEKWDGISPLVVGGGDDGGANILVPMNELQDRRQ